MSGFIAHGFGQATPTLSFLWPGPKGCTRPGMRTVGMAQYKQLIKNGSEFATAWGAGFGRAIDHTFFVAETAARGPLLLHAQRARKLRFFDHELYWLENSDHDLCCRAMLRGWVCGFINIELSLPSRLKSRDGRSEGRATAAKRNESKHFLRQMEARASPRPTFVHAHVPSSSPPSSRSRRQQTDGVARSLAHAGAAPVAGGSPECVGVLEGAGPQPLRTLASPRGSPAADATPADACLPCGVLLE